MKLYELIDFEPRKSNHTYVGYKKKLSTTNAGLMGTGSFGTGYDTRSHKRPDEITKVGKTGNIHNRSEIVKDIKNDGYLSYLKAVFDSGSNNPYFPRFSDLIVKSNNSTGELIYRVNLQKLIPYSSDKLCGNEDLMNSLYDDMFIESMSTIYGSACSGIQRNIEIMLDTRNFDNIKDPDLLEALEFITKIIHESDGRFVADLHFGNMMWRITGTRPQLVFTDPVA